ncbi:MAG: cellulose synthase family protein [Terriglobia bacterium]
MFHLYLATFILEPNPVVKYFQNLFFRDPFRGLYEPNAFDVSILVPYFVLLGILSIFGAHRYGLIYLYLKNKKNAPKPAGNFAQLPRVTIQLPIFNERYVVERLIEAMARIDYPPELLDIQVLDDSTDETVMVASRLVSEAARSGCPISYHHRGNREGYKAGALAEGMKTAKGEFIAIFDSDFVPPPQVIRQMIHYFTDPKVAVVQGRWTWLNRHYSNLTEVQAILLDGHFVIEHGGRNFSGRFFNFNGTAGMWRRAAIEDAGGWQHDTLTEDTDLSYRAQLKGWKFVYDPTIECPSELPVEMNAFKTQQARWAKGLVQVALKLLPTIWRSDAPFKCKVEATLHLTCNFAYPLMTVFSIILLPAMIVRFYQGWFQMLYLDLPLFLLSTCSFSSFYMMGERQLYPKDWWKRLKFIPFLMATGIGLTIRNSRAVLEAVMGKQTEFVRTAKFRVEGKQAGWERKKYLGRAGWIPFVEMSFAVYFLFCVAYSLSVENYLTVPFLMLFVMGHSYMSAMSLFQTPLRRLANALPALLRPRQHATSPASY